MCIELNKIEVSNKDIEVFKLFLIHEETGSLASLFYTFNSHHGVGIGPVILENYNIKKDNSFNKGYGYHCFSSIILAEEYATHVFFPGYHKGTKVIRMTIPERTRYSIGKISHGYIGEGLLSIRAERLRYEGGKQSLNF